MAAPPARAQAYYDYDYLIRLLPIGDSGELAEPLDPFLSVVPRSARDLVASGSCFLFRVIWRFDEDLVPKSASFADGCAKCERVNEFNHWTAHGGVICVTFMLFESLCPCLH
jgi:hypothetical protein